jgi:hypothetical protein
MLFSGRGISVEVCVKSVDARLAASQCATLIVAPEPTAVFFVNAMPFGWVTSVFAIATFVLGLRTVADFKPWSPHG